MKARHIALFSILLSFLPLAGLTSAANMTLNQTLLNASVQYASCKVAFSTSFMSYLQSQSHSFSFSQYSNALAQDNNQLSVLAQNGNVSAYESFQSKTFDTELDRISSNISSQVNSAGLSANALALAREHYNSSWSAYANCTSLSLKSYAEKKLALFTHDINAYTNETASLSAEGVVTANLTTLVLNAQDQIVIPLNSAISSAKNNTQILQALQTYCLFDGCHNGTNFHLAAHYSLDKLQDVLGFLDADKNVSASALAGAQTYLNNASAILATVGANAYVNGQGKSIFANLSDASRIMAHAKSQDLFAKEKAAAERVIAAYNGAISADRSAVAGLAAKGWNTTSLNVTLSQATSNIIVPLEQALNASTNATQLMAAFKSHCLENSCTDGTDFHLALKLKLGEDYAYLGYQEVRANSTALVIVNQTALAAAQSDLSGAASLLNAVGSAQITQSQSSQFDSYLSAFAVSLREAFRANAGAVGRVNQINVTAIRDKAKTSINSTVAAGSKSVNHTTTGATTTAVRTSNKSTSASANTAVTGSGSAGSANIGATGSADAAISTHGK